MKDRDEAPPVAVPSDIAAGRPLRSMVIASRFTVATETTLVTYVGSVLVTADAFYLNAHSSATAAGVSGLGAIGGIFGLAGTVVTQVAAHGIAGLMDGMSPKQISPYYRRALHLPAEVRQVWKLDDRDELFAVPRQDIDEIGYWGWCGEMKLYTWTTDFTIDLNPFKLLWTRRFLRSMGWEV